MFFNRKNHRLVFGLFTCASAIALVVISSSQFQGKLSAQSPQPASVVVTVPSNLNIQLRSLKASSLHEGMSKAHVEQIMGTPSDIKVFPALDTNIEIFNYRREPMITKVSFIDGTLSGVTTEVQPITRNALPLYAQALKIGMSRQQVIEQLGQPLDSRKKDLSIYQFEQLAFRKGDALPINVILRDGFVEAINTGLENPAKQLGVILPAEPILPKQISGSDRVRIGMSPQQAVTLFGQPTVVEQGEVQQQQISNLIYSAPNTNATTRLTFTNNVLTRFAFIPQSSLVKANNNSKG
jgi:outer membrane protein assembly factor BamE (lipoprotein component of BamABCDE complex)